MHLCNLQKQYFLLLLPQLIKHKTMITFKIKKYLVYTLKIYKIPFIDFCSDSKFNFNL